MFEKDVSDRCLVIAEIAQSHDGSLGMAHAYIDAVADAGADAVKFQTHIARAESTYDEPWRLKFSKQDATRYDYWRRMEFSREQWRGLSDHAREKGLIFLSSPFSVEAVEMLSSFDMPFWKVASGEIGNYELMEAIWATKKPILFSTGMCSNNELDSVVERTKAFGIQYSVFQCTSEYPCLPQEWGLNLIQEIREKYHCPVGFSDHSGGIIAGLSAITLGVSFLEVHVTFSRGMFGPDVSASVSIDELRTLVQGARQIRDALEHKVNKDENSQRLKPMRKIFGRSWALKDDLPGGTILKREHLTLKKPGSGIPYEELGGLINRRLRANKQNNRLLTWEDIE